MTILELADEYQKAQQYLNYSRKELVRELSKHTKFKNCDKYLDSFRFDTDGIVRKVSVWNGPDDCESKEIFHSYDEFPVLEIPF